MRLVTLYLIALLIWSTTWIAIKLQLGIVAAEVSVAYRFFIASIATFLILLIKKEKLILPWSSHIYIFGVGFFMFSVNYLLTYWATLYLTSGLVALLFSTLLVMNIINTSIFFRKPFEVKMIISAGLGLSGMTFLFWQDVEMLLQGLNISTIEGVSYILLGTYSASLGNMFVVACQRKEISTIQVNAYGMLYGSLVMGVFALYSGSEFLIDTSFTYMGALLYLALLGSCITFLIYVTLIKEIGPEKTSYIALLTPMIALVISTFIEGYEWTNAGVMGVVLVLLGNYIIISKRNFENIIPKEFIASALRKRL